MRSISYKKSVEEPWQARLSQTEDLPNYYYWVRPDNDSTDGYYLFLMHCASPTFNDDAIDELYIWKKQSKTFPVVPIFFSKAKAKWLLPVILGGAVLLGGLVYFLKRGKGRR